MCKNLALFFLTVVLVLGFSSCSNLTGGGSTGGGSSDGGEDSDSEAAQYGTIVGTVRDAVSGDPLHGVSIEVFNNSGDLEMTVATDSSGDFSVDAVAEQGKTMLVEMTGYLSVTCSGINVGANVTSYLETIVQISEASAGTGDVSGVITDAATGNVLDGVTVGLREGVATYDGPSIALTTTSLGGQYSFVGYEAGHYTAEIARNNYITAHFTLCVIGDESSTSNNYSITPNIFPDEIRVILEWGGTASDLDSHTTGPLDGSSDRFHVYYANMGDDEGSPYTLLSMDDVTSYGPETTTIFQQFSGDYYFYVHDYGNRAASESTALGDSRASVRLYIGSTLIATFNVPSTEGTLWKIFALNGSTVTPINQMMYERSVSRVSAM